MDFQAPGVLLESADGAAIPAFASAHVAAAADVQHPIIPRQYALNTAGLMPESLAHVRDKLAGERWPPV